MITDITLCSLPGGPDYCEDCLRNFRGRMLPNADEPQFWLYPRKAIGECADRITQENFGSDKRETDGNRT